jgi:hypothetical protein
MLLVVWWCAVLMVSILLMVCFLSDGLRNMFVSCVLVGVIVILVNGLYRRKFCRLLLSVWVCFCCLLAYFSDFGVWNCCVNLGYVLFDLVSKCGLLEGAVRTHYSHSIS